MKRLVAVAVVVVAAFSIVGTAPAQTGNATIDGNTHPNVGALLRMRADGSLTITCSGTLIAPRVFLTAGHCAAALYSRGQHQAYVTFDPFFGTDATRGYQIFSTPYHGAVINNPDWHAPYQNDTAIVYLDAPVSGITPAKIAPLHFLDDLGKDTLRTTDFTNVGYGTSEQVVVPTFVDTPTGPVIISVVSTGDVPCYSTSVNERVDLAHAQNFPAPYLS